MPSLKDLRVRIDSVKSTKKITSAMKMVAASKLRRAQEQAEAGRPYAERMGRMLGSLAESVSGKSGAPPLLAGTGEDNKVLFVLVTANRGLCGGFNTNASRRALKEINEAVAEGKDVKIICVGRKGFNIVKRQHSSKVVERFDDWDKPKVNFATAAKVANTILGMFENGEFDRCVMVYNQFKSVMSQPSMADQLIPFSLSEKEEEDADETALAANYEFEPGEKEILEELLPRNLAVQVYTAMLDSAAGEQAARMTAMDNATRNAGEMIDGLTLTYNRTRQAFITKELIEIISGAEAV